MTIGTIPKLTFPVKRLIYVHLIMNFIIFFFHAPRARPLCRKLKGLFDCLHLAVMAVMAVVHQNSNPVDKGHPFCRSISSPHADFRHLWVHSELFQVLSSKYTPNLG